MANLERGKMTAFKYFSPHINEATIAEQCDVQVLMLDIYPIPN